MISFMFAYMSGVLVFYVLELTRPLDGLPCKEYQYPFLTALLWPIAVAVHVAEYIKEMKR